jgi:hypothetical protein
MIATLGLQDNVDLDEVVQWVIDNCVSFVEYRVVEIDWSVDMDDRDPWFKLEVTFRDDGDATLFLLRWA